VLRHLHHEIEVTADECLVIHLDRQAPVYLLSPAAYREFRANRNYSYTGGTARTSPLVLKPTCAGVWHLIIDLGDHVGPVDHSIEFVRLLPGASPADTGLPPQP
jgi:hypothetical protein